MIEAVPPLDLGEGRALLAAGNGFGAHEVWERQWKALPHGPPRRALQGLIHLAVALEHHRRGSMRSAVGQWDKALGKLADGLPWPGIDVARLLEALTPCMTAARRDESVPLPDLVWLDRG
ncbi:MAG: DUF309 domain-containing protein [Myxococcales bacterium]|nr:DUF309 domain-containing protein [Myxococcales bacterium]